MEYSKKVKKIVITWVVAAIYLFILIYIKYKYFDHLGNKIYVSMVAGMLIILIPYTVLLFTTDILDNF